MLLECEQTEVLIRRRRAAERDVTCHSRDVTVLFRRMAAKFRPRRSRLPTQGLPTPSLPSQDGMCTVHDGVLERRAVGAANGERTRWMDVLTIG